MDKAVHWATRVLPSIACARTHTHTFMGKKVQSNYRCVVGSGMHYHSSGA